MFTCAEIRLLFVAIFAFWSVNLIAGELEQPFQDDLNDLPMHECCDNLFQELGTC